MIIAERDAPIPGMNTLRIAIDDGEDPLSPDTEESLHAIASVLAPGRPSRVRTLPDGEILVLVDALTESEMSAFTTRIIGLSATTNRSFTLIVELDERVRQHKPVLHPYLGLCSEFVIHVRPDTGEAIHGFLRYLLGSP